MNKGLNSVPRFTARAGFTLVELLVVMGIITVLIGTLMPAVSSARFESRTIQCRNNVRQVTMALLSYAAEFRGNFPPNTMTPAHYWYDETRMGSYLPVTAPNVFPTNSVFVCPEDEGARRSYSMNHWASSKVDLVPPITPVYGKRWGQNVKFGSGMLLLVESWSHQNPVPSAGYAAQPTVGSWGDPGKRFGGGGGLSAFPINRWGTVNCELDYARHRLKKGPGVKTQPRGRIVVSFADGHVELLSNTALVDFDTGVLTRKCFWSLNDL